MKKSILTIVLALLSVAAVKIGAADSEEAVIPAVVQNSIALFESLLPVGSTTGEISEETENGLTTYEAEFQAVNGLEYEVEFDTNGRIMDIDVDDDDDDDDDNDDDD